MKRITTIEIGGKEYPMKFSIEAMKAICEKYGSLENMVCLLYTSAFSNSTKGGKRGNDR